MFIVALPPSLRLSTGLHLSVKPLSSLCLDTATFWRVFLSYKGVGVFLPWKRSCDHPPSGLLWSSSLFKSCSVLKCWSDHWCSHSLSLGLFCWFLVKFNEVVLLFIVVVCCLYDCVQITVICIGSVKSLNCMDTVERSSLLRWSRGHL